MTNLFWYDILRFKLHNLVWLKELFRTSYLDMTHVAAAMIEFQCDSGQRSQCYTRLWINSFVGSVTLSPIEATSLFRHKDYSAIYKRQCKIDGGNAVMITSKHGIDKSDIFYKLSGQFKAQILKNHSQRESMLKV